MACGLNKVMIIGTLIRNPEMRFTPSGRSVANFCVGCKRSWNAADSKQHTETEWFNVVAWGKLAEYSKQTLQKDNLIYLEGRLQTRAWQDEQGCQHHSVEIIARDIVLLSDKSIDEDLEADGCE